VASSANDLKNTDFEMKSSFDLKHKNQEIFQVSVIDALGISLVEILFENHVY